MLGLIPVFSMNLQLIEVIQMICNTLGDEKTHDRLNYAPCRTMPLFTRYQSAIEDEMKSERAVTVKSRTYICFPKRSHARGRFRREKRPPLCLGSASGCPTDRVRCLWTCARRSRQRQRAMHTHHVPESLFAGAT